VSSDWNLAAATAIGGLHVFRRNDDYMCGAASSAAT
jgi:hypothetical protein